VLTLGVAKIELRKEKDARRFFARDRESTVACFMSKKADGVGRVWDGNRKMCIHMEG